MTHCASLHDALRHHNVGRPLPREDACSQKSEVGKGGYLHVAGRPRPPPPHLGRHLRRLLGRRVEPRAPAELGVVWDGRGHARVGARPGPVVGSREGLCFNFQAFLWFDYNDFTCFVKNLERRTTYSCKSIFSFESFFLKLKRFHIFNKIS